MVCLLHQCELPFRHLFKKLDGTTANPIHFQGPIGKLLAGDVWKRPIQKFKRIEIDYPELPTEVVDSLSTDAQYLYKICDAVSKGELIITYCISLCL